MPVASKILPVLALHLLAASAAPGESRILNPWPDAGDAFGLGVAARTGLLAVGAPGDDAAGTDTGVVHLFRNGRLEATLVPGDAPPGAAFGSALAMDHHRLVVGAPRADGTGAVYVYERGPGGVWLETAKIRPDALTPDSRFGGAVALDGDRMVAGAPFDSGDANWAGAVYVFTPSGAGWSLEDRLVRPGAPSGMIFGSAVGLEGDVILAGAPYLGASLTVKGEVHVYTREGEVWSYLQELSSSIATGRDRFGTAVAISRGHAVAGAPRGETLPPRGAFTAYAPRKDPDTRAPFWEEVQAEFSPEPEDRDHFGRAVAVNGHGLLVGAPRAGRGGAAFLYRRRGHAWEAERALTPAGLAAGDAFGESVALSGIRAAVGAPGDDGAAMDAGVVYTFHTAGLTSRRPEGAAAPPAP